MKHLPAIDGLRAIAVLAVVAYHAGLPVPAGFVGVDVFFVISGYVITRMLAAEHAQTGRIDFAAFYARRVRRILPALLVMVVAVVLAAALRLPQESFAGVVHSGIAALAVTANLHFMTATAGYFAPASADMPLLHTWSLSVEEQFYFVWPLVLLLRRKWILPAIVVVSFLASEWLPQEQAFYQMPARCWELAVGGCIAFSTPRQRAWLAPCGLALLAAAVALPLPHFPGAGALPAVAGTGMVLAAVHAGAVIPALETAGMRFVGHLSYSLYLWHWPVLVAWRLTHLAPASVPVSVALCLVAGVIAWASYRWIETPFRRQHGRRRFVVGGVTACLTAILVMSPLAKRADAAVTEQATYFMPKADAPPTVALIGDSHAWAWEPLAGAIAHHQQTGLTAWTTIICPPALGYTMHVQADRFPEQANICSQQNEAAMRSISNGSYDTVVLAARWLPLFQQMPNGLDSPYPTDAASIAAMKAGLARMVDAIAPHVRRIIIMGPVPQLRADPSRCESSHTECGMTRAQFDALARKPLAYFSELAAQHPNVTVLDATTYLCGAALCPMERNGVRLYRDDDHISTAAAEGFARSYLAR
jgi:peptidoglycan/LPS O-acetylase OafA/YrhL